MGFWNQTNVQTLGSILNTEKVAWNEHIVNRIILLNMQYIIKV